MYDVSLIVTSASVVSLPAEGRGKRAIDFDIKMSLMRLGGWA